MILGQTLLLGDERAAQYPGLTTPVLIFSSTISGFEWSYLAGLSIRSSFHAGFVDAEFMGPVWLSTGVGDPVRSSDRPVWRGRLRRDRYGAESG